MKRAFLGLLLAGCSAWIDADSYRGGDGSRTDAEPEDAARSDAGSDAPDALVIDGAIDVSQDTFGSDPNEIGPDVGPVDAGDDVVATPDAGPDVDPCTVGPDADRDGISDACDDWPCGLRPVIPTRVTEELITISRVRIHGMGTTAVVRSDETFQIDYNYSINDPDCDACILQIEIGFTRIGRLQCPYNDNPPPGGASGLTTIPNIPIPPGSAGLYELRFNLGRNPLCPLGGPWHEGEPPASQTVGAVCVVPVL